MVRRLPDGSPVRPRYRIPALSHRDDVALMVWIGYLVGAVVSVGVIVFGR